MSSSVVDWGLAERISARVAGASDADARPRDPVLSQASLAAACEESERLIRAYSGLEPPNALPSPEPVGRGEWSRSILTTLHELTDELERGPGIDVSLLGPLGGIARSMLGAAMGGEVGVAAGYAARRVLGQYDLNVVGQPRPPRLLFVAPNVQGAARELRVDLEPFARWVALHETTHAVQFATAPWLRDHLGGLIKELISGTAGDLSLSNLLRRIVRDPRGTLARVLRGDVARAVAGPGQAGTLDSIQATMTVIEGHAEHVMDAAAGEFVNGVDELRAAMEARRAARGPIETILARLLGMDLKLRQYESGKAFCDAVAAAGGQAALNRLWEGPDTLPSREELERPQAWLDRLDAVATSASATTL